jgi:hypothetical protein
MTQVTIDLGKVKFNWRGAYDSSASYKKDDVVEYGGSSYVCIQDTNTHTPLSPSYWELMAQGGDPASIMTSEGDLLVRGATGLERLPKGADGQSLIMENGSVTWGGVQGWSLIQRQVNVTEQPGTWGVPHGFGWVPHCYTNFTPQSDDSIIRWQVHFSADSRDTGSISTGAMARSNTDGSSVTYKYYVNNSGHDYYYGHSQYHVFEENSWGSGTPQRVGFMMGKHSSGYPITAHQKTWGSPSDPGGTSDANDDRSCYIIVEEWLAN